VNVVVSDATPLNYLVLINALEILPRLYSSVLIPPAVLRELSSAGTPAIVADLVKNTPSWLNIRAPLCADPSLGLDAGENEAIGLAIELGIEAVLMDERKGRRIAVQKGLAPIGTLAILERAASRGWIDFDEHTDRLRATTFRIHEQLVEEARARLKPGNS
jgi:predicted nucleic acid-binding protein